jgi:hypothetical protein
MFQILIINITNIHSIKNKLFTNSDNDNNNLLIIWKQLGFYFGELNPNYINIISYIFICLSFTTLNLCYNEISFYDLKIVKKYEENIEKNNIWYNPYLILHICRIMGIIWLYIYQNFLSFGIFLWLFFSFLYLHISTNDFWTKFALIPSINISFICISVSRINDILNISNEESIKIKYFHFALGEYDYDYLRYFFIIIFYFFANYFLQVLNIFNKKIISSAIKYREEEEEKNEKNKIKNNINIINLLIKIFLANIDKITLVSLYIVIFPTINFPISY